MPVGSGFRFDNCLCIPPLSLFVCLLVCLFVCLFLLHMQVDLDFRPKKYNAQYFLNFQIKKLFHIIFH